MNRGKNRAGSIGAVAAYLIYTAWELFQGRNKPDTGMAPTVAVLFAGAFVLAAAALLLWAFRLWKKSDQEDAEKKEGNPDSMK